MEHKKLLYNYANVGIYIFVSWVCEAQKVSKFTNYNPLQELPSFDECPQTKPQHVGL